MPHDDLPFVKDSVAHLFELGIKNGAIHVVFENIWHDDDGALFEEQLVALADHIIDRGLELRHLYLQEAQGTSPGKPVLPG